MSSPCSGHFTACGLVHLLALLTLAAGCSQPAPVPTKSDAVSQSHPPDRVEPSLVDLTLVDRAEFDAVLARLAGKVVLVDCWATWCGPCVEQLPHSIALAKEKGDAGLEVVTLNFDDPESAAAATKILEKSAAPAAHLTNLQTKFGGSSESMNAFEITSGALPHYKLFDRKGQLRHTFELEPAAKSQFTPADIDAAIAKLLAER